MTYRIPALLRDLRAAFPDDDPDGAFAVLTGAVDAATEPQTAALLARCHYAPSRNELKLHAADAMLGGYGVEFIARGRNDRSPAIDYVNVGDPYTPTLLLVNGIFRVGAWGDIVERGHYD